MRGWTNSIETSCLFHGMLGRGIINNYDGTVHMFIFPPFRSTPQITRKPSCRWQTRSTLEIRVTGHSKASKVTLNVFDRLRNAYGFLLASCNNCVCKTRRPIGLLHRFGDTAGWVYRSGVYCTNSDKIVFKSHVSNFIYYVLVRCWLPEKKT